MEKMSQKLLIGNVIILGLSIICIVIIVTLEVNNMKLTYIYIYRYFRSGTNTLGIIFFCLAFGTVLGSLGKAGKTVIDFFVVIDEVILKMVYGIMW